MSYKTVTILLVFIGETLSMASELIASQLAAKYHANYPASFFQMFILIALGGALLVAGYMIGYFHLRNIWIITAISIGSILIVEPLLALLLFRQLPTFGAAVGLTFGLLGTLAALFLK